MKKIFIGADMHCGHKVGLTPPEHQGTIGQAATRAAKKQFGIRRILWHWFAAKIKEHGPYDAAILNSDMIEGTGKRSGGVELLTTDRDEQVAIAASCIQAIPTKSIYMTLGTPYHVGEEEDWERILAREVKAKKIEEEGHYDINGLQVAAKHFIGGSSSPVSAKTALTSAQIKNVLWSLHKQQPLANLIIRSHIHRCYHIGEPALNFQGWVTPGLQGLGGRYATRQLDPLPVVFGFLVLRVWTATKWGVEAVIAPLELQAASVIKL